jgi:hypothetical protein
MIHFHRRVSLRYSKCCIFRISSPYYFGLKEARIHLPSGSILIGRTTCFCAYLLMVRARGPYLRSKPYIQEKRVKCSFPMSDANSDSRIGFYAKKYVRLHMVREADPHFCERYSDEKKKYKHQWRQFLTLPLISSQRSRGNPGIH